MSDNQKATMESIHENESGMESVCKGRQCARKVTIKETSMREERRRS